MEMNIMPQTILSQHSVEQGEGKPPILFDKLYDKESCKNFAKMIEEKVRKFSIAIQMKYGYDVVLRKTKADDDNGWIFYADIREARQSYVFITNGYIVEYKHYKEV